MLTPLIIGCALPFYAAAEITSADQIVSSLKPAEQTTVATEHTPINAASDATVSASLTKILSDTEWFSVGGLTLQSADYKPVYSAMSFQPLWVDSDGLNSRATQVLKIIEGASQQGLNAERYALGTITQLQTARDADSLAALDLLISHAVITYAHDLHMGATQPTHKIIMGFAARSVENSHLLESAYLSNDIEATLQQQTPQSHEYAALKKLLVEYQALAAQGGWKAWRTGRSINPGDQDARIPDLREILVSMGDFSGDISSSQYDSELKKAVLQFQQRHGLNPTGVVNAATQKALMVPTSERVRQITATMERMRWMPDDMGGKYAIVNIPAYELHAYENNKEALSMRVIVGKATTHTPQFSDQINEVVFNPTWSPTDSIIKKEMIPKLKRNPDYFVRAGFKVFQNGEEVDPHDADFAEGGFRFRQGAGDGNALGKIKFNMPDTDDIYLHSTASPRLFAKEDRALSHGCIRLEKPRDMAHFVMDGMSNWDSDKVDDNYDSDTTRYVKVSPIAVHVVYWTAWVDEAGLIHFYTDIYHSDDALLARMQPKNQSTNSLAEK